MNAPLEFEEESTKDLKDYINVFKRRYKLFFIPAGIILVLAIIAVVVWPPTYKSEATILIEQQEIPQDFVRSTVTSLADQQIQEITQRVMTLKTIMGLVEQYELFDKGELERRSTTEIAIEFRDEMMGLNVVSAEVVDPRTGRPTTATIAFSLSFKHGNAAKSQKIANELVNLYLNENLRLRTEKSANTSAFLKRESEQLAQQLQEYEQSLADFKDKNKSSLPEFYSYNLSIIDRTERELLDNSLRLKELEKRKLQLEGELLQSSRYAPTVLASGERVLGDYDRLKALESEYRRKSAVYNENHPDLIRLSRELEELKTKLGTSTSGEDMKRLLRTERDTLASLQDKYAADHPEVQAQQRIVADLEQQLNSAPSKAVDEVVADNPAYIFLESQLKGTVTEINILKEKSTELKEKLNRHQDMIAKAPVVEQEYSVLQRGYQNTQQKYAEIKARLMEADLSRELEEGRQGQRFTLIQPPVLPEDPVSPNRPALLIVGFILAVGAGLGVVLLAEALDPGVRGSRQLADVLGAAPLISIPYIQLEEEQKSDRRKLYYLFAAAVVAGIVGLLIIHMFIKPLDVIWFVLMRKLGM
jgi:uncharacterized protein involved in exopolysaccharide biosynthesis